MIVLIGANWASAEASDGGRRLLDPEDHVRVEVASALANDLLVLPVLVQGAVMPRSDALPDDLKRLTRRNALELSDSRWQFDLGLLVEVVRNRIGAG